MLAKTAGWRMAAKPRPADTGLGRLGRVPASEQARCRAEDGWAFDRLGVGRAAATVQEARYALYCSRRKSRGWPRYNGRREYRELTDEFGGAG